MIEDQQCVEQPHQKTHGYMRSDPEYGIRFWLTSKPAVFAKNPKPAVIRCACRLARGIGHDLIANPDQRGDEQYLEDKSSPTPHRHRARAAILRPAAAVVVGARCSSPQPVAAISGFGGAY